MTDLQSNFNDCLFHASSAIFRRLAMMADAQFKMVELTPTQGFILMTLKKAPGITISDLARVHQLDPSTMTRALDKLVLRGYVHRESMGKITRVFPTDGGARKEADAKAAWKKLKADYGKMIGTSESLHIARSLAKALSELDK